MFYGEGLALTAAVLWGSLPVLVRKGLLHASASLAVLLGLLVSVPLLFLVIFFHPHPLTQAVALQAAAWFALAGILGSCVGRVFNYLGIARLGAARATPLIATSPLFTTVLALMFLREQITLKVLLGVLCIVAGIIFLTGQQRS